jgi:ribosomal protein S12 methylthiotransferase accessory factor
MQQAIAVDLTRPEYGVAVVRVVVPGLEGADHDASSFVPGARARALQRDG